MPDFEGETPRKLPPVHLWNPEVCRDIGMRIDRTGAWHYAGSEIKRQRLINLFASIMRKDPDGHWLVTPVEKVAVTVEDAPFLAGEMQVSGEGKDRRLVFRTNVGDVVTADEQHPLRLEAAPDGGFRPYICVRAGLEARLTRPLALDLADLLQEEGDGRLGVWSGGVFFAAARG